MQPSLTIPAFIPYIQYSCSKRSLCRSFRDSRVIEVAQLGISLSLWISYILAQNHIRERNRSNALQYLDLQREAEGMWSTHNTQPHPTPGLILVLERIKKPLVFTVAQTILDGSYTINHSFLILVRIACIFKMALITHLGLFSMPYVKIFFLLWLSWHFLQ